MGSGLLLCHYAIMGFYVEEGKSEGYRPEFHGGAKEERLLGNDAFLEKALSLAGQQTGSEVDLEKILAVVWYAKPTI